MEVVSHPAFTRLHPTGGHPETPKKIEVLLERFPVFVECGPATEEDILRCHTPELVERVRTARGWLDSDTICTETTFEAALLAAGAMIEAVRRGGFAFARPPGHHATPTRAMGFCLFNTIAVAARWAQAELGLGRVAILDWDVHHGNGTQDIFAGDDTVLFVSLHQWPFYPGHRRPRRAGRDARQPPARGRDRRRRVPRGLRDGRGGDPPLRAGAAPRLRRVRRARGRPAGRARALDRGFRRARPACLGSLRASRRCSRAATTSRRCPTSSGPPSRASGSSRAELLERLPA